MSTPQRLNAEALTAEQLDPMRIGVARAIATGQSADWITSDLSLPASWSEAPSAESLATLTGFAARFVWPHGPAADALFFGLACVL